MRRHLFLYLALACFAGLIAISIVDGYMGIYNTVYITTRVRARNKARILAVRGHRLVNRDKLGCKVILPL